MPLLHNDDNRLVDVTVESNIEAASGTSVNNIVDGISSTYFSATVPANEHLIFTFTLNNNRREWFNRYSIQASASNAAADPQEWKLLGSNDGTSWIQLDYRSNEYFTTRREVHTYDLFGNRISYSMIRLEIVNRLDDDEPTIRLGDIQLFTTVDISSSSEITLTYTPKETYYVGVDDYLDLYPKFSGYHSFIIDPPLPEGLNLTTENGRIYGTISEKVVNTTTYHLNATSSHTSLQESTSFVLKIQQCNLDSMSMIEIRKYNVEDSALDKVAIFSGNDEKGSFYGVNSVSTTIHRFCIAQGSYRIDLSRASSSGWSTGSYIDIYLYYEQGKSIFVGTTSLRDSELTSIPISTSIALPKKDNNQWHIYSSSQPIPSNWYQSNPSGADWTPFELVDGKGPEVNQTVWFMKRNVVIDSLLTDIQSYELAVYCRAGLVVYINGNEVYRVNVPEGAIVENTTITGGAASPYWHRLVGLRSNWNNGVNVLSIAVVNAPFEGNMTLDTNVLLYFSRSSGTLSRTFNIVPEASSTTTGYPLTNLFDGDYSTRVIMERALVNTTQQYWGFYFKQESAELINKYCFISNNVANRFDPVTWDVYASETGVGEITSWTLLDSITNMRWKARGQRACFTLPSVEKAYRFYRFLLHENVNQLPDNYYSLADIELYSLYLPALTDADLTYSPMMITSYYGIPITSMQPSASGFSQCSVNPELPTGISLDSNSGVISGTPVSTQEMTTYTVNCKNQRGTARTATVTITIESCASPKKPFYVVVPDVGANGENMKLSIYGQVSAIGSIAPCMNYQSHYYSMCAEYGTYKLIAQVTDTNNNLSWGDRYASVYLADNREIVRVSTLGKTEGTTDFFIPYYVIDSTTQWKYNYGMQPLENWQNNNGTETWSSEDSDNLPATDSITQYYIASFTVSDISKVIAIETQVRIQAGIVVYLNGNMIMFANIPVNGITNATLASTQYAIPQVRKNSMQNNNLIQPTNTIAVEIHRGSSIPSKNTFMLKLLLLTDKQERNIEGFASTNTPGIKGHEITRAFDVNGNTYYGHEGICENTYLQWNYNGASNHYVNSYSVIAGDSCLHLAPSSWKFEGSRDGKDWVLLDVQSNIQWTTTAEEKHFKFYNENNYAMFRLTVTQCQQVSVIDTMNCPSIGLRVYDVTLRVAQIDYTTICEAADGFPTALTNSYSYGSCDQYYSGYKRRYCNNKVFMNVESFCTVSAPSSFSYPQESYELVYNATVTPIEPTIVCADCNFNINPDLPSGLVLDSSRGIITGTPMNITANTHYTITASNVAGSSSVVIDILSTNETVHCYMDIINGWENTLVNTTAIKECPSADYAGNMTRTCLPGSPAIWDVIVNNCELLLPNITITNTTYSFIKNDRIQPILPTVTGAGITSITVQPMLPSGLYLDPVSASISGIPTQKIDATIFTITVTNANGSASIQITITVIAYTCTADGNWRETDSGDTAYLACPNNKEGNWYRQCSATNPPQWMNPVDECKYIKPVVNYPSTSYALQRGQTYTITPTTQFYITSWSLSGSLPMGLTFSNMNGVISGTPNTVTPLTMVTVTASNPDKVTQVSISFSVNVYKCAADGVWPETEVGQTVTRDCDNVVLKEGSTTRQCTSTVSGPTWQNPVDTCKFKAPILTYASTVIQARKGETIQTVTPTIGNQIDSITINPALPPGLQFHPNSGAISGTPSGDASNLAYTVTAMNADARTEVVLQITISVAACPAQGIWDQTERGEQAYAWCNGAAGIQVRTCGNPDDDNPQWKSVDNSGCIANPQNQKPGEGTAFVRFTLQLANVASFDATAYAAVRRVLASGLGVNEGNVFLESYSAGTFSVLAVGTSIQVRVTTGIDNGENMKNQIIKLCSTTLSSSLRGSNVASLGTAQASCVESSFDIKKYSIMNNVATTLVVIVVIMGVVLIAIGVFFFLNRSKNTKSHHNKMASDNRAGKRTKKASIKSKYDDDDDYDEKPKKKKTKKYDDDSEEEERPKKKKSKKYDDDDYEEEKPKKKKSKKVDYDDDDDYEEKPKKKSKKSKKYDDSD